MSGSQDTGLYRVDRPPALQHPSIAIGFCPRCESRGHEKANYMRMNFRCPSCGWEWIDPRRGKQTRQFDDYFSAQ
jgi:predicted RNA-binding Zn-ribbon protein involved in translation (DUF1610 family)